LEVDGSSMDTWGLHARQLYQYGILQVSMLSYIYIYTYRWDESHWEGSITGTPGTKPIWNTEIDAVIAQSTHMRFNALSYT
jgi:hypothetical protein